MHSGWYAGLVEFSLPLDLPANNNLSVVHQNNTNGALKLCWVNQNGSQCRHPTALLKQPTMKCMTFFPPFTPFTRTKQWASGCRFPHTCHYKRGTRMNDTVLAENYTEEMNAPPARIMDGSAWHHYSGAAGDILLPTCPNWVSPAPIYWGSTHESSEKQENHTHIHTQFPFRADTEGQFQSNYWDKKLVWLTYRLTEASPQNLRSTKSPPWLIFLKGQNS